MVRVVGTNPFLWHEVSDVNEGEVYMETNFKLMLASLAGVVIGAASIEMLSAQGVIPAKAPPAYLIAEVEVTDPAGYKTYQDAAAPVLAATGGRFLVQSHSTGHPRSELSSSSSIAWKKRKRIAIQQLIRRLSRSATNRPSFVYSPRKV